MVVTWLANLYATNWDETERAVHMFLEYESIPKISFIWTVTPLLLCQLLCLIYSASLLETFTVTVEQAHCHNTTVTTWQYFKTRHGALYISASEELCQLIKFNSGNDICLNT